MLTHPDLLSTVVKQHVADLTAEAEQDRVLSLARRHRRSVSAARRAAAADTAEAVPVIRRHASADSRDGLTPKLKARQRFASAGQGSLSACDKHAA